MNLQQLLGNNKYVTKQELQDIINYFASLKYVQGPPGKDAQITNEMIEKIIAAATPIKGIDYNDGERGKRGKPGKDGKDGDEITPEQLGKKLKELPDNLKIKIGDLADADVLYNKIREVVSASDSIGAALQAEADAREALEKKVASITISRGASGALNFLEGGTNLGKYPNLNLVGFTIDETGDTITVTSPGVTGNTLITSADNSVDVTAITGGFDLSVDVGSTINNWTSTEWNSFLTDFYTNIDWSQVDINDVDFSTFNWSQVDITEVDFSSFDWTQVDISQFNETQWNDFITNLTNNWTTANWNDFTSSLVSNWSVANYNDFTDGFITNITELQSQELWNELSTSLTNTQLQNFWNSLFTNLTNAQVEALGDLVFNNLTTTQINSIITGINDNITSEQVFDLLNNITGANTGDTLIWNGTEWELGVPGGGSSMTFNNAEGINSWGSSGSSFYSSSETGLTPLRGLSSFVYEDSLFVFFTRIDDRLNNLSDFSTILKKYTKDAYGNLLDEDSKQMARTSLNDNSDNRGTSFIKHENGIYALRVTRVSSTVRNLEIISYNLDEYDTEPTSSLSTEMTNVHTLSGDFRFGFDSSVVSVFPGLPLSWFIDNNGVIHVPYVDATTGDTFYIKVPIIAPDSYGTVTTQATVAPSQFNLVAPDTNTRILGDKVYFANIGSLSVANNGSRAGIIEFDWDGSDLSYVNTQRPTNGIFYKYKYQSTSGGRTSDLSFVYSDVVEDDVNSLKVRFIFESYDKNIQNVSNGFRPEYLTLIEDIIVPKVI